MPRGTPSALAISATALAAEDATTGTAGLMYPAGFAAAVGLTPVVVPGLATPLVLDQSRCKARVAAAIPDPAKALRKRVVTGQQQASTGSAQPERAARKTSA